MTEAEVVTPIGNEKKFCMCCGLAVSRILEKLESCEWKPINQIQPDKLVRCDGLHFQFETCVPEKHFYTKKHFVMCCEYCGIILREEDLKGEWDFMGDSGGRPERQFVINGYRCHYCDREESFER